MKRLIAAVILFCMAGVFSFLLKDFIDSENPEYAIAQIEVTADTTVVGHVLAGYEWSFYNGRRDAMPTRAWFELEMTPYEMLGGEKINIEFTLPAQEVMINRLDNNKQDGFVPSDNDLYVPFDKGGYLYEVHARFRQGWVLYYFYIVVI